MGSRFTACLGIFLGVSLVGLSVASAIGAGPRLGQVGLAAVGLLFAALGVLALRQKSQGTPDERFLAWLRDHEREVLEGTALYEGVRITPETRLVRYSYVVSAVVLTMKQPTRLYIEGVERTGLLSAAYTLTTLVFGWWGIPWGPIYTIQAVFSNLTRRDSVSVGAIFHASAAEEEPKPDHG